jgi:hypothetical protein
MTVRTVNVSTITRAVLEMLRDDLVIGGKGVQVERATSWDFPPGANGWVGVYRRNVRYPPRALGMTQGFREQRTSILVLVRESNYESGEACEDALEDLLQRVMSTLLNDHSLKGTVDTLGEEIVVTYDAYEKSEEGPWVQTAFIQFEGLVRVSVL